MPIARTGDADIAYEIVGTGDPLVMLMGLGTDARMWMFQTPVFAERYGCFLVDNRGVGGSSRPPGPWTMEDMASDTLAVLDDAGVERAHILGISMGGAIAQHLALKAPERVRSLLLAATWCARNPYLARLSEVARLVADVSREALIAASMLWLFTPRVIIDHPELLGRIEQLAADTQAPVDVFLDQVGALLEHDVCDRLRSLDIPTRVLAAERDILVPRELSEQVATVIPGADLVVLEGAHAFNVENADAFNRAVLEFLERG